jgi:hypothetical protein
VSDKVAFGWTYCCDEGFPIPGGDYSQFNNDIHILIDEDGLNPNFDEAFNLTNFLPPDSSYLPDTLMANMDTLRAYTDMNLFIDQFQIQGATYYNASIIWHWSEQYPDEFKIVRYAFDPTNEIYCGGWNLRAQRPSLGQDPATGYLYCVYQEYDVDSTHISAGGWPSGEIYVSVSTDGGLNWSEGTNITNTITPQNAPAGECFSEAYPSLCKTVDGECHVMYVLDRDAGNIIQSEGSWTLNDVTYHKVPVDSIPTTPLVPQWPEPGSCPFHVMGLPAVPDLFVDINLVSGSPVPAGGGPLVYDIFCANTGPVPLTWDGWIDMVYEGGVQSLTIICRQGISNFLPGWTINRPDVSFTVPAGWPGGNYECVIHSGVYPDTVWHQDSFAWVKEGAVDLDFDFEANLPIAGVENPFDDIAVTQETRTIPAEFEVNGAHPNPFNLSTTFSFTLPEAAQVELKVYNLQGQLVATLIDGLKDAGSHDITFDASQLASGIYIYRFFAGEYITNGKLILVK